MPSSTDRALATGLFVIYVLVNLWFFVVIPTISDVAYWGVPVRDALGIGLGMAVGIPLFAATFGLKPG
jgi:hypothetical protein